MRCAISVPKTPVWADLCNYCATRIWRPLSLGEFKHLQMSREQKGRAIKTWRRGGIEASIVEREVGVGERCYVSCFQTAFLIRTNSLILWGYEITPNASKVVANVVALKCKRLKSKFRLQQLLSARGISEQRSPPQEPFPQRWAPWRE